MKLDSKIISALDKERILNLRCIVEPLQFALGGDTDDMPETALRAANALPSGASDFDRGIAAGFALAVLIYKAGAPADAEGGILQSFLSTPDGT
jgi:hypothetical protein